MSLIKKLKPINIEKDVFWIRKQRNKCNGENFEQFYFDLTRVYFFKYKFLVKKCKKDQ